MTVRSTMTRTLASVLLALAAASPAQAITYRFTSANSDGPMTLTVTFSDSAVDADANPLKGDFAAGGISMLLETNTFTMQHDGAFDTASVNVLNPLQESLTIAQFSNLTITPAGSANPTLAVLIAGPNLLGGSDDLPLVLPPTLTNGAIGAIVYEDIDGDLFYGTLRTIEVIPTPPAVPEPASATLSAAALGGLVLTLMRRRR